MKSPSNSSARICRMSGLRGRGPAAAAQRRTRADLDLSPHAVAAGRLQLPASADLLGLWRRGDRTLRTVGRRMDDAGAAVALPALGHVRHRQRAARQSRRARDGICRGATAAGAASTRRSATRTIRCCSAFNAKAHCCRAGNRGGRGGIDLMVRKGGHQQCAGKSATTVTTPDRSICWPCVALSSSSSSLTSISLTTYRRPNTTAFIVPSQHVRW